MHVVVTGATGNLGTSCLVNLAADPAVTRITGISRRPTTLSLAKTTSIQADVAKDDLIRLFLSADVVVHLAWVLQSSHDAERLHEINVMGSTRVAEAAATVGVPKLIVASSVGAYSPGRGQIVDETHPTTGIPRSTYSQQKVEVERMLDTFEARYPDMRIVRLRPALVFKYSAASEILKLFGGPLVPRWLMKPGRIPFVPSGLDLQCVHSLDVGRAIQLACSAPVRGAFNLAADPMLDSKQLAELLHAPRIPIPRSVIRAATAVGFALRVTPSEPGWIDLAYDAPRMSSVRAKELLGWAPRYSSEATLLELLDGMRNNGNLPSPPLVEPSTA